MKLHEGESEDEVQQEFLISLSNIPYGEVVEVEQELISEGLPEEEVVEHWVNEISEAEFEVYFYKSG